MEVDLGTLTEQQFTTLVYATLEPHEVLSLTYTDKAVIYFNSADSASKFKAKQEDHC